MRRSNRLRWLGAIALAVIFLLTLIAAPSTSHLNSGSTYSRAPDGYGAWYTFMLQRGTPVQRWQKPFSDLPKKKTITLLRVNSKMAQPDLNQAEQDWVEKGNTLVVLGVQAKVSEAALNTIQPSSTGNVKIDTGRRHRPVEEEQTALGDRFDAVVWEEHLGQGRVIFSTTPHLAANAYQDYTSNYNYLAQLVGNTAWVDEYIHGYKDPGSKVGTAQDWVAYLARTPLLPALLQGGILLLVTIWAQNRRFGVPQRLAPPQVNNSEAYIQALASVLQKAECSEFVLDVVGKQEQLQLQKALGLGQIPIEQKTLVDAMQQTGASTVELEQVLQIQSQKRRVRESELLNWLGKWQTVLKIRS